MTAFALATAGNAQAKTGGSSEPTALYIVQMAGAPLASYDGSVAGYAATKPDSGHKLDTRTAAAKAYGNHLRSQQSATLAKAGVDNTKAVYQYSTAFNGVAARLTTKQAQTLQHTPGVLNVFKNHTVTVDTVTTPSFLGLSGSNGVWQRQFGGPGNAGDGVIIADIDTGFWPENPSFAALPGPRKDDALIASKWHGTCDPGQDHPVTCNNKVIGARWFDEGHNSDANPAEYKSPRDYDGHGSHTASTAAGDNGVAATINGISVGAISGMAPGARLAVYKVLYEDTSGTAHGADVDIVKAIDQAVADGADVINFSVGDNADIFGADELAFMQAAAAGVFVSAAAGNSGPKASTVDNAMPWETTVAAGTHDRSFSKTATLGNGSSYTGVGVGAAVPSAPLVDSSTATLAGQSDSQATQCYIGTLDPAKVTGKIVLCQRGGNNRTDKSKAVQQAGGVGMILFNPTPNSLNADFHFVPTVHVDAAAGTAIKQYIAGTANPTASLSVATQVKVEAPAMASFSSRGPSPSSGGSLLKPDIMAPGNDVIAAVSPSNHSGNLWDTESGTSMATPHIAGIAALILSRHPDWPPMWVKSAIMTTATTLDNQGKPIQAETGNATPLDFGSGEVVPASAFNPGLVYDSTPTQWLSYSCGIGVHLTLNNGADSCTVVPTITPSQLNYPSIAFGALAGKDTVTRTVTNITHQLGIYFADVKAPAGYKVTLSPPVLVVAPGRTASYTVTVQRTTAPLGGYSFGSVTLRDFLGHKVFSPIAVQSVPLAAPLSASGTGTSGSTALSVRAGYTGTLTASAIGLAADTINPLSLTADPDKKFDPANPATSDRTGRVDITVPSGTKLARFATFAADYPSLTDVDMYVYSEDASGKLTLVGESAGTTADESVDVTDAGRYAVFVDLFNNPGTGPLNVKLHSWILGSANAGNVSVSPASQSVTLAGTAKVTASWSGLVAGSRYLGFVEFGDGTNQVAETQLTVNP